MSARIVAAYVRVSTDKQDTLNQRLELERMATGRGENIQRWYDEIAGGTKERPELARLMADAHRGKVGTVYVWALDRLGRRMLDVVGTVERLDAAGVRIVSARDAWLGDLQGPMRGVILAVMASLAQFERERLRERTLAGLERAKRQGKQLGRPSVAPSIVAAAKTAVAAGQSIRAAARDAGIGEATLRRALKRCRARV